LVWISGVHSANMGQWTTGTTTIFGIKSLETEMMLVHNIWSTSQVMGVVGASKDTWMGHWTRVACWRGYCFELYLIFESATSKSFCLT
jgi:hypothetical protein